MAQSELFFLVCDRCGGSGVDGGGNCRSCTGRGMVASIDGHILAGAERIDAQRLGVYRVSQITSVVIEITAAAFASAGVLAFGYTIFVYAGALTSGTISFSEILSDPEQKQLAIFWVGILSAMFLVYHRVRRQDEVRSLPPAGESGAAQPLSWDTIDAVSRKHMIDITRTFEPEVWKSLITARGIALKFDKSTITPPILFSALVTRSSAIRTILLRLGIDFKGMVERLSHVILSDTSPQVTLLDRDTKKILYQACARAYRLRQGTVGVTQLLAAVVRESAALQEVFADMGVQETQLEHTVAWLEINERVQEKYQRYASRARLRSKTGLDRAMTASATPFLNRFSEDITDAARRGALSLCVGREREFESIFRLAETGTTPSMILVGNRGVGIRALIEGLAEKIVGGDVPPVYAEKRLVRLDTSSLIAGASASEAHERMLAALTDAIRARNVIICIENLHELFGISVGGSQSLDLAEVLAEAVSKGLITLVATSHPQQYAQVIERSTLGGIVQKLDIEEMDTDGAIQVLELKSAGFESTHGVYFSYQALESAVALSKRYIHDQYLPEKAIRLLEESAVHAKTSKGAGAEVTAEDVAYILSQKMHVPVSAAGASEAQKLLHLEEELHRRVIGQDEAVRAVASALRRARAELRDQKRPIASFLFLGPTGVGKTELAKAIAQVYFGSETSMVRLDMSEFQDSSSVHRLIGAPAGFAGGGRGQLTEAVRQNPYTIVLLDELEKAHADILNLFLQVMDDGRLSDSAGTVIDFTNTIIIATSNAGATYIQDTINAGEADIQRIKQNLIEHELRQYYRPEFLNRFDGIIVFKPLTLGEIEQITRLMLTQVAAALEKKNISFKASDEAVAELAKTGFDPQFGARPLRRAIQERVDNALAELLLKQKIGRRDTVILEVGGVLRIEKAQAL